jgi:hypothetical protein
MAKELASVLHANFNQQVQQAKERIGSFEDARLADALEHLCDAVVKRWWVGRVLDADTAYKGTENMQERMNHRMQCLVGATQAMVNHSGNVDPNSLQVSVLGLSAELNGLWGALIEAGILTPAARQDYMDAAVIELQARVKESCKKILIAAGSKIAS